MRAIVAIAVLVVASYFALQMAGDPAMRIPLIMFAVGVVLFVVMGLRKLAGRDQPSPPQATQYVTVCLGIPRHTPKPVDTFNALPDYCRGLFR